MATKTLRELVRDDVVEFLKDYDSDEVVSKSTIGEEAEVLVDEIMETISEKLLPELQ